MSSPANSDEIVDPAMSEAVERRKRWPAPRFPRTALLQSADQPGIDHDDLLSLLDRPRPAHGDIHMLLRRRSVTRGEAEETPTDSIIEGRSAELTRRRW
jgi:hypothetical protein